jgi:hypothetical protein
VGKKNPKKKKKKPIAWESGEGDDVGTKAYNFIKYLLTFVLKGRV